MTQQQLNNLARRIVREELKARPLTPAELEEDRRLQLRVYRRQKARLLRAGLWVPPGVRV
jgi:hypothetical protein